MSYKYISCINVCVDNLEGNRVDPMLYMILSYDTLHVDGHKTTRMYAEQVIHLQLLKVTRDLSLSKGQFLYNGVYCSALRSHDLQQYYMVYIILFLSHYYTKEHATANSQKSQTKWMMESQSADKVN